MDEPAAFFVGETVGAGVGASKDFLYSSALIHFLVVPDLPQVSLVPSFATPGSANFVQAAPNFGALSSIAFSAFVTQINLPALSAQTRSTVTCFPKAPAMEQSPPCLAVSDTPAAFDAAGLAVVFVPAAAFVGVAADDALFDATAAALFVAVARGVAALDGALVGLELAIGAVGILSGGVLP